MIQLLNKLYTGNQSSLKQPFMEELRDFCIKLEASKLSTGREKALCITKLEEAAMWLSQIKEVRTRSKK